MPTLCLSSGSIDPSHTMIELRYMEEVTCSRVNLDVEVDMFRVRLLTRVLIDIHQSRFFNVDMRKPAFLSCFNISSVDSQKPSHCHREHLVLHKK